MKKIAIFNHKGGVSKTTTCYHLGCSLADKGKRVLMVDADSQCNLTMYALGRNKYEDYYEKHPEDNIHRALQPVFRSDLKPFRTVTCPRIRKNLVLLPGHLDFTENEVQLGMAMQLANSALFSMQHLPGAIERLVQNTVKALGIDYVLFDMNPSLSAINEDIFICCDYFMIPTSPDLFSMMAIRSLSRILPSWEIWARRAREAFKNAAYPLPDSHPKFLGYTVNDFNLSNNGRPTEAFSKFIKVISREIAQNMIPALQKETMTLESAQYQSAYEQMKQNIHHHVDEYPDEYCLALISNFNKLIALAYDQSCPVFDVTLPKGSTPEQRKTQNWFRVLYPALADRVLELTK